MLVTTSKTGTPERDRALVARIYDTMIANMPRARRGLTVNQMAVHRLLWDYQCRHGHSPTFDELGRMIGQGKGRAHGICQALRRKGYVEFGGSWRGIKVLTRPQD